MNEGWETPFGLNYCRPIKKTIPCLNSSAKIDNTCYGTTQQ